MTKQEFINSLYAQLADEIGASTPSKDMLNLVFTTGCAVLAQALEHGDAVQLPGVGTLKPVRRAARNGRNPRTGEAMRIPAATVLRVAQSSMLKL